MKKIVVAFLSLVLFCELSFAQYQTRTTAKPSWRRNAAIVLFSGIGGSLLGLSTLSFYGQPKEHTNNITIGALLGALGGVGWVVHEQSKQMRTPTRTYDYYGMFPTNELIQKPNLAAQVPTVQYQFTF